MGKDLAQGLKKKNKNKRGSQEATHSWLPGALHLVPVSTQLRSPDICCPVQGCAERWL